MFDGIGIIGGGAFGTALGMSLAGSGRAVRLWARDKAQVETMAADRCNARQLPGLLFPDGLDVTADLQFACAANVILLAVPTQALRGLVKAQRAALAGKALVACCKGVELGTGALPTEVLRDEIGDCTAAVLTGPSFAADIARGKPTALTLAADENASEELQNLLATPTLRLYASDDLIGAQLGGALKNVVAIGAGIAIGADLGESARAALMTRGYAEMVRYATGRGARAETLAGLSGFGDLVLTCTSEKSRNFNHGRAVGARLVPDASKTVEGVMTAHAVAAEAQRIGQELPVTQMVSALLKGQVSLDEAVRLLLARPLRREHD